MERGAPLKVRNVKVGETGRGACHRTLFVFFEVRDRIILIDALETVRRSRKEVHIVQGQIMEAKRKNDPPQRKDQDCRPLTHGFLPSSRLGGVLTD
jgi:hypothetical protein